MSSPESSSKAQKRSRKKGQKMTTLVNAQPLFQGYVEDHPLTEDLDPNDDLGTFVQQKPKGHRQRVASEVAEDVFLPDAASPTVQELHSSFVPEQRFSGSKFPRENYIFVANLTRIMSEEYLKQTFEGFGEIMDISIVCRDSNSLPFAYIAFKDAFSAAAAQAQVEVSSVQDRNHVFRVEPRKTFPHFRPFVSGLKTGQRPEPIVQEPMSQQVQPINFANVILNHSHWKNEIQNFNWKACASRYLYRDVTMEDYLVEYIHTQASYRMLNHEPIKDMIERLKVFAETKPEDVKEMMPPSVSGVVYNQTRDSGDYLNTLNKLLPADKFRIDGTTVFYINRLSQENAEQKLREILVEGLFVYFFAKFCHGPKFKIKLSFYQRSEPIKSSLMAITGTGDVQEAIHGYFYLYSDIFVFDEVSWDLTMVMDYFDKVHRDDMKPFRGEPAHKHPSISPLSSSQKCPPQTWPPPPEVSPEKSWPEKNSFQARDGFNCVGKVKRLIDNSKGELEFPNDTKMSVAHFKRKDTYIEGKRMTADMNLSDHVSIGDFISFNANCVISNGKKHWSCSQVWIGKPPLFIERMIANREGLEEEEECSSLDEVPGRIQMVATKKCGYIRFLLEGKLFDAYFSREVYIGKETLDLKDTEIGTPVLMNVEMQSPHRGVHFRATRVWEQRRPQDNHEAMQRHIDELLEPAEVTESIIFQPVAEELPFAVQSVVQDVFIEDHEHKILSNPLAIDRVLFKLNKYLDPEERSMLKIQIEKETRLCLSRFLAERIQ